MGKCAKKSFLLFELAHPFHFPSSCVIDKFGYSLIFSSSFLSFFSQIVVKSSSVISQAHFIAFCSFLSLDIYIRGVVVFLYSLNPCFKTSFQKCHFPTYMILFLLDSSSFPQFSWFSPRCFWALLFLFMACIKKFHNCWPSHNTTKNCPFCQLNVFFYRDHIHCHIPQSHHFYFKKKCTNMTQKV